MFQGHSPIVLLVTDPNGNQFGCTASPCTSESSPNFVNTLPSSEGPAVYNFTSNAITIDNAIIGIWTVQYTGTGASSPTPFKITAASCPQKNHDSKNKGHQEQGCFPTDPDDKPVTVTLLSGTVQGTETGSVTMYYNSDSSISNIISNFVPPQQSFSIGIGWVGSNLPGANHDAPPISDSAVVTFGPSSTSPCVIVTGTLSSTDQALVCETLLPQGITYDNMEFPYNITVMNIGGPGDIVQVSATITGGQPFALNDCVIGNLGNVCAIQPSFTAFTSDAAHQGGAMWTQTSTSQTSITWTANSQTILQHNSSNRDWQHWVWNWFLNWFCDQHNYNNNYYHQPNNNNNQQQNYEPNDLDSGDYVNMIIVINTCP